MSFAGAPARAARSAGAAWLAQAVVASRQDTLATLAAFENALPALRVPQRETLNPPLWELGHIGWFQAFWTTRNPQWRLGAAADPAAPRMGPAGLLVDVLYDSSAVPHATRWALPLPDVAATGADMARQLSGTLALLREAEGAEDADDADDALYFFRLALLHEDMHHEAALYSAQSLGVPITDPRWQAQPLHGACTTLAFDAGTWTLGHDGPGFAFDNELGAHTLALPASHIDNRVLSWAEFLPFVEAGGYQQPQWWCEAGNAWVATQQTQAPRYLRRESNGWQQWRHGVWGALNLALPACHLTAFEAAAWCRWAGRRLPSEAEWERAAMARPDHFAWGTVWEWTASTFAPYPGFQPHPYRDYSAPWFGSRPVLRGASFMTQPRLRHPHYRNFFLPDRNDVPAGFRTCRL